MAAVGPARHGLLETSIAVAGTGVKGPYGITSEALGDAKANRLVDRARPEPWLL